MTEEQPMLAPEFDLDAWIDGTCGVTALARIIQRGDLIATRIELEEELKAAAKTRPVDRGVTDRSPEHLRAQLDEVNAQIWGSSIIVTLQDRTTEHRKKVRAAVADSLDINQKDDPDGYFRALLLAEIADSIVKVETPEGKEIPLGPAGFGWERLAKIRERCGDAALIEVVERYQKMTSSAPAVQAPF